MRGEEGKGEGRSREKDEEKNEGRQVRYQMPLYEEKK